MKRRNRTAAALIGAGLTLTGSAVLALKSADNTAPETEPRYFPANVREALEEGRDISIDFWKARGVPLSLRNFIFLEGEATVPNTCNDEVRDGDHHYDPKDRISSGDAVLPGYCPKNDAIFINPAYDKMLPDGEEPGSPVAVALAKIIMFHESVHYAQNRQGIYHDMSDFESESQADCYAGYMTSLYNPEYYDIAADLYTKRTDGDELFKQFERGFNDAIGAGQTCENY